MTIDVSLAAMLDAILTAYPGNAPDDMQAPFCIYSRQGTGPDNVLAGVPVSEDVRFEIDIHAATYAAARGYAESIKAALQGATFGGYVTDDRMIYEPVVGLHRCVIDFQVRVTT